MEMTTTVAQHNRRGLCVDVVFDVIMMVTIVATPTTWEDSGHSLPSCGNKNEAHVGIY